MLRDQTPLYEKEYEVEICDSVVRKLRTTATSQAEACERAKELIERLPELPEGELLSRSINTAAILDGSEATLEFEVRVGGDFGWWFHQQELNIGGAPDGAEASFAMRDFCERIKRGDITPGKFSVRFEIIASASKYRGLYKRLSITDDRAFKLAVLTSMKDAIDKELQGSNDT